MERLNLQEILVSIYVNQTDGLLMIVVLVKVFMILNLTKICI